MAWEPTIGDQVMAHTLGVRLDDSCKHCHHFLCICYENERADTLNMNSNTNEIHQYYDYE